MISLNFEQFLKLWKESMETSSKEETTSHPDLFFTNGMSDHLAEALRSEECLAQKYRVSWD